MFPKGITLAESEEASGDGGKGPWVCVPEPPSELLVKARKTHLETGEKLQAQMLYTTAKVRQAGKQDTAHWVPSANHWPVHRIALLQTNWSWAPRQVRGAVGYFTQRMSLGKVADDHLFLIEAADLR